MEEGIYVPLDIFAVKMYGIERWRREFFWPVSDDAYRRLCNDIEVCLRRHIDEEQELVSDVLIGKYILWFEYCHFLHALKVIQDTRKAGKIPLCSPQSRYYKNVIEFNNASEAFARNARIIYSYTHYRQSGYARLKGRVKKYLDTLYYNGLG